MTALSIKAAMATTVSSTRRMRPPLMRYSKSTLTMAPCRKAIGMPRNTIQIRLKRINTSVHSAGDSRMNRVTI